MKYFLIFVMIPSLAFAQYCPSCDQGRERAQQANQQWERQAQEDQQRQQYEQQQEQMRQMQQKIDARSTGTPGYMVGAYR